MADSEQRQPPHRNTWFLYRLRETIGASPLHPSRDIVPAPSSGNCLFSHTSSFPMEQSNTLKPFCKTTIKTLQIGCGTATLTRAGGGTPPTGCKASGENEKISGGKIHFPIRYFYRFHCARGYIFLRPSSFMRKQVCSSGLCIAKWVQGQWPWRGVQGLRKPLPHCMQMYIYCISFETLLT